MVKPIFLVINFLELEVLKKNRVKTLPSPLKTLKVLSGLVCDSYQNKLQIMAFKSILNCLSMLPQIF
ncbi:hypothetical protein EG359_02680 [Chryseobacterium joostei]|uniref:Uncharacterized protein n=1 Tax=Chryseobacterium joostei TaxID=112234 RepID=A0ABN5S8S6_9FLAO|nr:hypothetical protein EG359_02680 [Chryseobacterium joostei]